MLYYKHNIRIANGCTIEIYKLKIKKEGFQ